MTEQLHMPDGAPRQAGPAFPPDAGCRGGAAVPRDADGRGGTAVPGDADARGATASPRMAGGAPRLGRGPSSRDGDTPGRGRRLAGAPISWGVCEVPGWGVQLTPERVLAEMASLGLMATELGPQGWLPRDGAQARAELDRHGLQLVGGFVPVVAHQRDFARTRESAARAAEQLAAAGGEMFVAALVQDEDWSTPVPLDDDGWRRAGAHLRELADLASGHGLTLVLHPHAGTLAETAEDIERALVHTDVPWCLDTGHLLIGGLDPVQFARDNGARIGHVHLKDVDQSLAQRVRSGELPLVKAVQAGLFLPLGEGDARIDDVVGVVDDLGYEGWLVLEQDLAITGTEPPAGGGPLLDVRRSIEFLSTRAPRRERVSQ